MTDLDKQARELLAAEYDLSGYGDFTGGILQGDCLGDGEEIAIRAIRAALTTAPKGFALVPVEPTEAMLAAGERAHWQKTDDMLSPTPTEFYESCGGPMGYAYSAMINAAPCGAQCSHQPKEVGNG